MKIGHFVHNPWSSGGIQRYIRRISMAQQARGHAITYLGMAEQPANVKTPYERAPTSKTLFERAQAINLDILHLHRNVPLPDSHDVPVIRTMHGNQGSCPSGTRYLKRWSSPCDRAYSLSGCLWGRLVDRCGSARPRRIWKEFHRTRREMEHAGQIPTLTVSAYLKEQMIRSGSPTDCLYTLHSPAPTVERPFQPPPPDDPPRFLFMGRVIPEKGVGWLLRSLAHVNTSVHIDIAGEGEIDMYRQMAVRLGVNHQTTFHGWQESEELNALIQAARAVVFPSVWNEPAGLVTLEAAAHGRPVIAGKVGGIPEYALDAFAFCVPPHDDHELAQRIDELACNRDRAIAMGQRGQQCVRAHFDMDQFVDDLHTFYKQAIDEFSTVSSA